MCIVALPSVCCSSNHLEACAALTALTKLITVDMIPAIINDVVKLLRHDRELVRKKVRSCCQHCSCIAAALRCRMCQCACACAQAAAEAQRQCSCDRLCAALVVRSSFAAETAAA